MTQQIEATGNSQDVAATLGGTIGHAKTAKKGLFTQLLNLVSKRSADSESSPKEALAIPAADKHQDAASLTKKPTLLTTKPTLIAGKQKTKSEEATDGQARASIAVANVMSMDTRALSGKPGKAIQDSKIEPSFLAVANRGEKQGQATQAGLHAYGNLGKTTVVQTPASKLEAADAQSFTNRQLPYSEAKAKTGEAHQAMLDHTPVAEKANAKIVPAANTLKHAAGSTPQQISGKNHQAERSELDNRQAISSPPAQGKSNAESVVTANQDIIAGTGSDGIASQQRTTPLNARADLLNPNALTNKTAHVIDQAAAQKPSAQHTPSQVTNIQQQAATGLTSPASLSNPVEGVGKQSTLSNSTHGESHVGSVANASQDSITGSSLSGWKSIASQYRAAPANGKTDAGHLNATKGKSAHLDSTPAQKSTVQSMFSQQPNSQQHAAVPHAAPAPVINAVEGLGQMADRSFIAGKYGQSASELNVQQALANDPVQLAQAQSSKSILPQTPSSSGPWSVSAAMQEIGHAASQERYRLELNLDPAHLGKIKVYLDSDANKQIQVHLVVDQSASRQIIEQHLPALRQALAQHGLDMGGFSMNSQHEQGGQDGQPSASQHAQNDYAAPTSNKPLQATEPQISSTNARLSIRV